MSKCVDEKVEKLLAEGKERDQAVAIATEMCADDESKEADAPAGEDIAADPVVEQEGDDDTPQADTVIAILRNALNDLFGRSRRDTATGLKVAGNRWMITWSNNFQDRDGEWFSEKAMDRYVARVDAGIVPPPVLQVWHAGEQTRIGKAQIVGRHGHFMIASGEFDDTPQGRAAKAYYSNPRRMKATAVSHGFKYEPARFIDKVYHEFNTFEISLLPRGKEANPFTSLEGVKDMALTDEKVQYLKEVFGEQADQVLANLDARGKALEEAGNAFKDFVDPTPPTSPAPEAVKEVEKDLKTLIVDVIGDNAAAIEQLADFAKAMKARDEKRETEAQELRDQVKALIARLNSEIDLAPRRVTDASAEVKDAEVEKEFKKLDTRVDSFWGIEVKR